MRIGIVGSLELTTPPKKYGGTELIVSFLTEGLVERGHTVTLFASGNSVTEARLVPGSKEALLESGYPVNPNAAYLLMTDRVVQMSGEFDLIHNHLGWRFLPFDRHCKCPVLHTYHSDYSHPRVKFIFEKYPHLNYSSLSENQRRDIAINFLGTVYNGINAGEFPFSDGKDCEAICYISRFDEQKGSDIALRTGLDMKKKMKIIGRVEKENQKQYRYYKEKVAPLLKNPLVESFGELDWEKKTQVLLGSKVFAFPVCWEEPFGLVMIEAMATGTPVVAFARGAVPEIIADGVTGFIVNSSDLDKRGDWIVKKTGEEGLREALERIYSLPHDEYRKMRQACRKHVLEHFTVEKMIEGYIEIYKKILNTSI